MHPGMGWDLIKQSPNILGHTFRDSWELRLYNMFIKYINNLENVFLYVFGIDKLVIFH